MTLLTLAFACVLLGCGKSDPETALSEKDNWQADPALIDKLKGKSVERHQILAKRHKLAERLAAERAKNPDSELVKDLQVQLEACDAAFEKSRQESFAAVRERSLKKGGDKK